MNLIELFILAIGLSMDAFAVAISKGLSMQKATLKNTVIVGLYFGGFQAGMPLIGYLLGSRFEQKIASFDHWIAFILLGTIGISMIREAFSEDEKGSPNGTLAFKAMLVLSIATSIDALAAGVTFAFLKINILAAISFIGICTFLLSMLGVKLGSIWGEKYKAKAEFLGGMILLLMALKIIISHLMEL